MHDGVDRETLKANYIRRLQKLHEQGALLGYAADPKIELEIEDIEARLQELDAQGEVGAAPSEPGGGQQPPQEQRPAPGDAAVQNKIKFVGPVGNVHIGSGDINVNVYGDRPPAEIVPQWRIGLLRRGVREHAPPHLAEAAQLRVTSLENAIRRHDADDAEDTLSWLERRVPALASQIQELRQYLSDWSA